MSIIAIVQARMGSSRLPGKVMMMLSQKEVLWHVVDRLSRCKNIDKIVIATTKSEKDNVVEQFCNANKISCFRGDEENVLKRYYECALKFKADHVVRITADCPLLDPIIIDVLIEDYFKGRYDFYGVGKGFPNGINGAIFSFDSLKESYNKVTLSSEKEHVGLYIKKNPNRFKIGFYNKYKNLSDLRLTLDTIEDYEFISIIYKNLYKKGEFFLTKDILNFLKQNPDLVKINSCKERDYKF